MGARCYCTAPLRPDGACVFKCPPKLSKPGRRAAREAMKASERDRALERYSLPSTREARRGMENLPVGARYGGVEAFARNLAKRG